MLSDLFAVMKIVGIFYPFYKEIVGLFFYVPFFGEGGGFASRQFSFIKSYLLCLCWTNFIFIPITQSRSSPNINKADTIL
jgi:hypothetical protein